MTTLNITKPSSNKPIYAILALLLFITEVIIATKLNDYVFIRAYFGDFLVVILLFCMVKAVITIQSKQLAVGVFIFATLIEVAQLFHLADILGLAHGGIARIVLGTSFSFHDLLMYAAGSIVAYWLGRLSE